MLVFRLTRRAFVDLDGEGARRYGGRWNSPGRPVVYTASTRALAALEYLMHIDVEDVPDDLVLLTIEVPDDQLEEGMVEHVRVATLPADWVRVAHPTCRLIGDAWLRTGRALLLRAPSAAIPEEDAVLINPGHAAAASRVTIREHRAFVYDTRLLSE